jgi:hypothetical protein
VQFACGLRLLSAIGALGLRLISTAGGGRSRIHTSSVSHASHQAGENAPSHNAGKDDESEFDESADQGTTSERHVRIASASLLILLSSRSLLLLLLRAGGGVIRLDTFAK